MATAHDTTTPSKKGPETFFPGEKFAKQIERIARRAGVSKALILRRCVEVALPMIESGEILVVDLGRKKPEPQPSTAEVGA